MDEVCSEDCLCDNCIGMEEHVSEIHQGEPEETSINLSVNEEHPKKESSIESELDTMSELSDQLKDLLTDDEIIRSLQSYSLSEIILSEEASEEEMLECVESNDNNIDRDMGYQTSEVPRRKFNFCVDTETDTVRVIPIHDDDDDYITDNNDKDTSEEEIWEKFSKFEESNVENFDPSLKYQSKTTSEVPVPRRKFNFCIDTEGDFVKVIPIDDDDYDDDNDVIIDNNDPVRKSESLGFLEREQGENKFDFNASRPRTSPFTRRHRSRSYESVIRYHETDETRMDPHEHAVDDLILDDPKQSCQSLEDQIFSDGNKIDWSTCFMYHQNKQTIKSPEIERVRVVVRVRPMTAIEKKCQLGTVVNAEARNRSITLEDPNAVHPQLPKTFIFDKVFDVYTNQVDFFNQVGRPVVDKVMEGYNGTIIAYGQTGSGKTYTMQGTEECPEMRGIIPNCFAYIFSLISEAPPTCKFVVRVAYVELYNEEIHDLLKRNHKLQISEQESLEFGVYIKDLSGYVVSNAEDMERMLRLGNKNRAKAATAMHERSSRSHAIFMVAIDKDDESEDPSANRVKCGKLILVDLAGSERVGKSKVTGTQFREASKINLSLLSLGNVIAALSYKKGSFVPYRNSKLTRLLQNSLGGNSKTVVIANIGPANYNFDETLSTLRFVSRAKNITNKLSENDAEHNSLLKVFLNEIGDLRSQIVVLEETNVKLKNSMEVVTQDIGPDGNDINDKHGKNNQETEGEDEFTIQFEVKEQISSEYQDMKLKQDNLRDMLEDLLGKVLVGGQNLMAKEAAQKELLDMSFRNLMVQETELEIMREQLIGMQEQKAEITDLSEFNTNLCEQRENLDESLKKVKSEIKLAKLEVLDKKKDYEEQIEELRKSLFDLVMQNEMADAIINHKIPPQQRELIMEHSHWDKKTEQWTFNQNSYKNRIQDLGLNIIKPTERENTNVKVHDKVLGLSNVYLSYTETELTNKFCPQAHKSDIFVPPHP